ncbi:MAG: helix-turn-helix transcriptional regulator [bacterium]|nr:helix-turn-helix transcriptional regulator [bacterium]
MARLRLRPRTLEASQDSADLLYAKFMGGLADSTRLRIVRFLVDGPRSVGEIIDHLGMSQSRVSNHLACLKWCGYVDAERQGRAVFYRLTDRRIRKILELAQAVVADNASHIAACTRIPV